MNSKKRFVSIKTRIMLSTLVPVVISFSLISMVIFLSLFNSLHETAKAEFLQIDQKYTVSFEGKINNAMNYLSIVSSILELQVKTDSVDREAMQKMVRSIFDNYKLIDGSSIYFEQDMYDGKDAEYIGSEYGTGRSGRICYYFYMDEGKTAYLPEGLENDIEFQLPHYMEAKNTNKPLYTESTVYVIDGRNIPMFTIIYPIRDSKHVFIGAVTVDLFLEEIYEQLQSEEIYETGYIVITDDKGQVISSPIFEDIGKSRREAGVDYVLPSENEKIAYSNAASIINGKKSFVTTSSIYIPLLDSFFYISVVAPAREINASGTQLIAILLIFSIITIALVAFLVYYMIGRISDPIKEITERANRIADGQIDEASAFVFTVENPKTINEVNILSAAIKKMLSQLKEMQEIKMEALELKHKKEKAEAAAQAKNDFLAKMSHEIRTPMNAVMGMIELILRKELPPDVYENALVIKSAGTNLLSIINDILDFSKIESGRLEIVETKYLFPSLINDVINTIRIRLIDKPIQFVVDIDSAIPASLIGDEVRIRQIFVNILNNAVKYTNEGYIALTVTGVISDNTVTFTIDISDSGIGIKEEDIGRLFGDFVQIDMVKNKGIEGSGLGLAIARNLCRAMGGDITARSEYGKGSTFTLVLQQRFDSKEPFASVDEPGKKSVLLYETRTNYRDSIIRTLEDLGIKYKSVGSIPSLLDDLEQYTYVFISSFMYGSINPVLSKMDKPPSLVLLADIKETLAPKDARILTLPTHPLSIANILNDIHEYNKGILVAGASFIAPEAKVLLVDDITANLKVGEGLLSPYEMQVTLCMSGREAIELIKANRYDLVFMDHMMPEMDGVETTGHIRAMEGEYFKNIPIIALTANAISGVREMFVQNGMNDFLSKPIQTTKLDSVLEMWIPKEKQKKVKAQEQPEQKNDFVDMLKAVSELSVQKALSVMGGSAKTYEKIVRLFIRMLPENITRLNNLITTDLPNYFIEIHGLKGVLNTIGAFELGMTAFELEKLSKQGDLDSCNKLHPDFIEKLIHFHELMADLMDKANVANKTEGDKLLLVDVISKLEEAADLKNSGLALEVLSNVKNNTFGKEIDKTIEELTYAFECFEFDKAAEWIEKLKSETDLNK